jgi:hypothetical protein
MDDLKERSGPWGGFWIQSQMRGNMKLRLQFIGDQLVGGGSDFVGDFEIRGFLTGGIVRFSKRYRSHGVEYEGRWDGMMIAGLWTMRQPLYFGGPKFMEEKGDFEIWPENGDADLLSAFMDENQTLALPAMA